MTEQNFATAEQTEAYDGVLSASASRRSYLDIEPNISVRTEFRKDDYYRFRTTEDPNGEIQYVIQMCMKAYDKVGIIKQIIDLMGNFASQGITLNHTNQKIQKFYRTWWKKISGDERSERFLNTLYRTGNVFIYKRSGKITKRIEKQMSKAADLPIKDQPYIKREIPFKYDFLNPTSLSVKGKYAGTFIGKPEYRMKLSQQIQRMFTDQTNKTSLSEVPSSIKDAIESGQEYVDLDMSKIRTFFYKKDDWQVWARPMIHAILDDIVMLEKMKLADMAALDGAISNIRLWRLGSLEHKIAPTKQGIDRLRNILASNVGGGVMDLVWGPELEFLESNSQVYKFLGSEKYQPVLSSIYGGLGIPATLTGASGQSGGFTNNFIGLKTLIEQLEYGRNLLLEFWDEEIKEVQLAMGFPSPATVHFDHMILSDENSEKNLLIQLADRNIISYETIRERLGESDQIESARIKKEQRERRSGKKPLKSDPFHSGNQEFEFKKISLQKGELSITDLVDDVDPSHPEVLEPGGGLPKTPTPPNPNGRPKFKTDTTKRKQKVVLPRSKPSKGQIFTWATSAQMKISELINPPLLKFYGKKNLRELSKAELINFELTKFKFLCCLEPFSSVDEESIATCLSNEIDTSSHFQALESARAEFAQLNLRQETIDELRSLCVAAYLAPLDDSF